MSALTDVFTAIANAIRSKKGVSTTYKPSEMADAIRSIQTGITPSGTKYDTYTSNGTYNTDVTSYANHNVTVSIPTGRTVTERVLWTNPSSTSNFGAQTVTFSSTFHSHSETLLINYAKNINNDGSGEDTIMYNFKWTPDFGMIGGDSYKWYSRSFQRSSGGDDVDWAGLSISDAFEQRNGNIDNRYAIPIKISAVKGIRDL